MHGATTTAAAGKTGKYRRRTVDESKRRIFPVTKHYLAHEMQRGCRETGVRRIRIHDLRHSHVSLLMDMGFTALAIGDRVGHSGARVTYRYAHLFPTVQDEMAERLDKEHHGCGVYADTAKIIARAGKSDRQEAENEPVY